MLHGWWKVSDLEGLIIENWSVEQKAKEVDVSLLQQVHALERRVLSAGLQVQIWCPCRPPQDGTSPVADRMCQGYRENKTSSLEIRRRKETSQEDAPDSVTGQADNPLETAVVRLEELERNIKVVLLLCLYSHAAAAAAGSESRLWHKALRQVRASAQLSLCIQHLQKSVVWEKSNFIQEHSRASQRRDLQSQTAGGGLKQSCQLAVAAWLSMEAASSRSGQNRTGTDFNPASCSKKAQISKDDNSQLAVCRCVMNLFESHQEAHGLLHHQEEAQQQPVGVPVRAFFLSHVKAGSLFKTIFIYFRYFDLETFMADVNLIFDNCEKFNEDDSEIGRAGHNMRRFFEELIQLKKTNDSSVDLLI
uniref:Bromodomain adjacent to zinc finger domain 2B n=1 Tax=Oryzias sinensis TaxID=183150 RepID=A0A8C7YM93_9TELE